MRISDIGTIELSGMSFRARHGCLNWEKEHDQTFIVDFSAEYNISAAASEDRLEDTLDYGEIYDIIKREMGIQSNLLENLAARIADSIAGAHPEIESFSIKVAKVAPPVGGPADFSAVTVRHKK